MLLAGRPGCGASYGKVSLSHVNVLKPSEIDLWLQGNSNRKLGLPSGSRSEVRFRNFWCFRVGTSPTQTEMGPGWASECSEWISGNSHQLAPHWAP